MNQLMRYLVNLSFAVLAPALVSGEEKFRPPVAVIIPLADHQTYLRLHGAEAARVHFDPKYPRPFFYPFHGPSGVSLTRMGHPGAPNHDHHRSVWFAHHKVWPDAQGAVDFWSDQTKARIRQKQWYAYADGDEEAVMAVELGWFDEEGRELMTQDVIAALRHLPDGERALEIQLILRPGDNRGSVLLGKTNFGILAVRVAKSISAHFGGGEITNSEDARGEEAIFGKPARWVDYSGPIAVGTGDARKVVHEGITYFDHPANVSFPSRWHVRADGWMGASLCFEDSVIVADKPLTLRYLLHAHSGKYDHDQAAAMFKEFSARPEFEIRKSDRPHRQFEVVRVDRKRRD